MKCNALTVLRYCNMNHGWESFSADEETEQKLRLLTEILDKLEPQGDDNYHSVWVKAKRPSFRQYYDDYFEYDYPYNEADANIIERAQKEYTEDYPSPSVWFQLATKHFTHSNGEQFFALFIDNSYVFSVNDCNSTEKYNGNDLLDWAISEAEKVIQAVADGVYQQQLQKIPYSYREGTIERRAYWEFMPEEKKSFLSAYSKRETNKFLRTFGEGKIVGTLLPKMTARTFYEACGVIYTVLKRNRECGSYRFTESEAEKIRYSEPVQTPKEMYYANADGRDNGLKNVPMDDADAFNEWKNKEGPYYDFNGSHPWEIIPSFSISFSMHLCPRRSPEGGYFFDLNGSSAGRAPETVIAANALLKAGYPVCVSEFNKIKDRIEGTDILEVVPQHLRSISEPEISLPEGDTGLAVAKCVKWNFHEYRLKGKN